MAIAVPAATELTIRVHLSTLMVMIEVTSAQFKAKMGQYMRAVRAGRVVVLKDRDRPVARVVPYEEKVVKKILVMKPKDPSAPPLGKVRVKPIRYQGRSSTELLRADRDGR